MAIKLLAVDMDGTFLDDNKRYDKPRFLRQFEELAARGIRFVAASGNQYATLCRYLPELVDRAAFVAENGAYVLDCGRELFAAPMAAEKLAPIFSLLPGFPRLLTVACSRSNSYCLDTISSEGAAFLAPYYSNQIPVARFSEVGEPILKLAFYIPPEEIKTFVAALTAAAGDLRAVTSGNGFVDLVRSDVNKAAGLRHLLTLWEIAADEVAAFGDNDNDLELLRLTPFSFAPKNAAEKARKHAARIIGSNNDHAVLDIIEQILAGEIG